MKSLVNRRAGIRSLSDVADRIEALDPVIEASQLGPLRIFNSAYLIITRAVKERFDAGYFTNGEAVEKLDVVFINYYLNAIEKYLRGNKPPPAWQLLFEHCEKGDLKRMCYLALGVNAHVNNDLGMSLADAALPPDFHRDFGRVNSLIYKSCPEIISTCGIGARYDPATRAGMRFIIRYWRLNAWRVYKDLGRGKSREAVEREAYGRAKRLIRMPWPV